MDRIVYVADFHVSRQSNMSVQAQPSCLPPDICRSQFMHASNWREKQTLSPLLQDRKLEQVSISCHPKISSPASGPLILGFSMFHNKMNIQTTIFMLK
jgi:hypothetical protein